jgi:hypothetical protein
MKTSRRNPGGFFLNVFIHPVLNNHMKKLSLLLLFLAQPVLAAEEALTMCRHIEEIAERVVCYDGFVDSHFPTVSSDVGSGASVDTITPLEVSESSTAPDAQSLFGTSDAEAKRIVEITLEIEQIDQIAAMVTDVRKSASKTLTVTLDNGQVWRQLDSKRLLIKSGEAVVVRKASLGSYLMEKPSGGRSIRVKRLN